ncbi:MAG: FecR domain-containing protein [Bacteroidota bacterium]
MQEEEFWTLLSLYLSKEASLEQNERLTQYLEADEKYRHYFDKTIEAWNTKPSSVLDHSDVAGRIRSAIDKSESTPIYEIETRNTNRIAYRLVAALLLLVSIGFLIWSSLSVKIKTIEVTADRGQYKELIMSDGTKVWLNAGSHLRYKTDFGKQARLVDLSGEAFFDVSRNEQIPFIIKTDSLYTQVLGTSFNVKAYPTEKIHHVSVLEGSVKIYAQDEMSKAIHLSPGERGRYDKVTNRLSKEMVEDISNDTAWRKGILIFDNITLEEVKTILERKFNVKIILEEGVSRCLIKGRFEESALPAILNMICTSLDAKYTVDQQKTIHIAGPGC